MHNYTMKKIFLTLNLMVMIVFSLSAQIVEKTFFFNNPQFEQYQGYEQISFDNCVQAIICQEMIYYRLLPPMKLRSSEVDGTSLSETGVK